MAGVPAAIEQTAWAGVLLESRADGTFVRHVLGGLLNHPPTVRLDPEDRTQSPSVHTAGDVVAIVTTTGERLTIDFRHATDGAVLGAVVLPGGDSGVLALDADRRVAYVGVIVPTGGIEIRRISFDGTANDLLVSLDKRFTPDGIPTERFGMTLDPDGALLVEACGTADGCRLWQVASGAAGAPEPITLPKHPPIVCSIVSATRDWLVVSDNDACAADTSDAALPYRAIRRSDGASHVITDDHVGASRVIEFGGRTYLVGADPAFAGATVNVVTYDIESGLKAIQSRGLRPTAAEQTVTVSRTVLPGAWVLLEPWFVEAGSVPDLPGRLLDLSSGTVIELPIGTSGWT